VLGVTMLGIIMLLVIILSVVVMSVMMSSVTAPFKNIEKVSKFLQKKTFYSTFKLLYLLSCKKVCWDEGVIIFNYFLKNDLSTLSYLIL
jgi:hypothetical protein